MKLSFGEISHDFTNICDFPPSSQREEWWRMMNIPWSKACFSLWHVHQDCWCKFNDHKLPACVSSPGSPRCNPGSPASLLLCHLPPHRRSWPFFSDMRIWTFCYVCTNLIHHRLVKITKISTSEDSLAFVIYAINRPYRRSASWLRRHWFERKIIEAETLFSSVDP